MKSKSFLQRCQKMNLMYICLLLACVKLCFKFSYTNHTFEASSHQLFNKKYKKMPLIHPTAIIGSHCTIHDSVVIEAYTIIEDYVSIGKNSVIGAHSVIGAFPKTKNVEKGVLGVSIGENVTIGQGCVVDSGIHNTTFLESEVYILPQVYIGHDCRIGKSSVISSGCSIGGYVRIGAYSNLGLGVVVHQFSTIGAYSMIGMNAVVNRDIPPVMKAYGNPVRIRGVNTKGIERLPHHELLKKQLLESANIIFLQKKIISTELECYNDFVNNSQRPIAKFHDK